MKKKGGTAQTSHERLDLMVTMRGGKKKVLTTAAGSSAAGEYGC